MLIGCAPQVVHWHATSGKVVGAAVREKGNNIFALEYRSDGQARRPVRRRLRAALSPACRSR